MSELHEYAYEDGRWGDLLTSVDGIDLEYDGSGNPTLYANGTELLWNMEWQNGRQLSRATTERDSTTEDVLDFAYDANGIRTRKTVTRNTYRPVQTYKVTFVADGKTVKTMNVTEGYTLKDSDYPAVPEKAGYTGAWQRYTSPVQSNVTVSVTYTKITTYYTVTFVADGETVKTISVYSGYKLKDSDYPRVPYKAGYEGSWQKRTAPVTSNVTINAVYTQILHTVSFRVMDEGIIHTMEVPDRYVLQEEDYPTIPKRVGYTSRWDTRVTMIVRDTIIDAIYSDGSTHEVTFLAYGNENLGTITVEDGYLLQEEDYPTIPERTGYRGSWPTQVDPIYEDTIIHAQYEEAIPVPTLPTDPGEIMSGGDGEPVEADEPEEGENDTTPAETERTISGVLASTETVTHEYLTQSGKVVRETITTSMDTTTLDFFYDESGRPFAFNYTPEGSTPNTYYYILNLQGDVVQIIDEGGVPQAEYVYSPWGEIISAEGDLAEVNPLRYRGYYYDSETGFYYLQSRYYDPENHRFINADSYASTGQGFLGVNMFAYCSNNPVNNFDNDGKRQGHASAIAKAKRKNAQEKYNEDTINIYMEGNGVDDASKLNVRFYIADAEKGYVNINIDKSLEITDVYDMYAVLTVIVNSEYYSEEMFGSVDYMIGQWIAHNECYNIASASDSGYTIMQRISGATNPIESARSLDLRCKNNVSNRAKVIYKIIPFIYALLN